jgi:hypothetical protein
MEVAEREITASAAKFDPRRPKMRLPQLRLKTVMIAVAFVALLLTVIQQAAWLQQSRLREEQARAVAERDLARLLANYRQKLQLAGQK